MSITETSYEHIILNEKSQAIIEGTKIKVIELVLDKTAYGWSPEDRKTAAWPALISHLMSSTKDIT
ncbi:hypothetical protein GWO43_18025 [candidate division KSB1 bacterium]|nr:hypothetical protein [candidate division KSB1 bacterium]NIR69957.1 hypothetical protein [candidate division KSB1 bacterium]NIS25856.1 hypothetical protein [candidate division KSB1 bacterium]NIT72733.1 hypothetical protein [candidate division KSB1 bacterium]NIU26545.1 hypothetical protein [candidate division KSB1 bacterium]